MHPHLASAGPSTGPRIGALEQLMVWGVEGLAPQIYTLYRVLCKSFVKSRLLLRGTHVSQYFGDMLGRFYWIIFLRNLPFWIDEE